MENEIIKYLLDTVVIMLHEDTSFMQQSRISNILFSENYGMAQVANRRRFWMRNRTSDWWPKFKDSVSDAEWIENFRLRKSTFNEIVCLVEDDMKPDDRWVRKPVAVDMRVAIAIYKLASSCEFRVVGSLFGVHKTSVHRFVHSFCQSLAKHKSTFIQMPNDSEAKKLAESNFLKTSFPQVYGAIDGCYIAVRAPTQGSRDFLNRKRFHSMILQAVADNQYRFIDVSMKCPGSEHDASVLKKSSIYRRYSNLPKGEITIGGRSIPLMILGDAAYPMLPWLMRPYTGTTLNSKQEKFNFHHSSSRIVIENAFGRLKARWRILKRPLDVSIDKVPLLVGACCILHNISEMSQTPVQRYSTEELVPSPALPDTVIDTSVRAAIANYLFELHH